MAEVLQGPVVGRLAPSPTGALHLGNVRTFMIAWLSARAAGGKVVFRMEDLDHPRDKPGAAAAAVGDLRWLGFDWDEEYVQSERRHIYREALEKLRHLPLTSNLQPPTSHLPPPTSNLPPPTSNLQPPTSNLAYPCVCSRRDVEHAQSAPHAGEQLHYPGTCRGRFATWAEALDYKRSHNPSHLQPFNPSTLQPFNPPTSLPCWRFRVEEGTRVAFDDAFAGHYEQDVARTLGDFPLARDEFGAGYTLAVVVDDAAMGVTEVVRGNDLLAATPAQILIQRALGLPTPRYVHVPLVVGPDGLRLAKRHGDTRIAAYRAAGVSPEAILGRLAASCGWCRTDEKVSLRDLLPRFDLSTIPKENYVI